MAPNMMSNSQPDDDYPHEPPYAKEEKRYLKEKFGNEYYFLRYRALSIYEEGGRAEGRAVARAFM